MSKRVRLDLSSRSLVPLQRTIIVIETQSTTTNDDPTSARLQHHLLILTHPLHPLLVAAHHTIIANLFSNSAPPPPPSPPLTTLPPSTPPRAIPARPAERQVARSTGNKENRLRKKHGHATRYARHGTPRRRLCLARPRRSTNSRRRPHRPAATGEGRSWSQSPR